MDTLVGKKFGGNIPSTAELEKRAALALVSINPAIDIPMPLPPNVIPVAGLHIQSPKPLPSDIEQFINAAQKGVVLFSLGTNVRSDMMDPVKQKLLLDAFAQLPDYHFLWKFESELETPKNVLTRKWLPQTDILAHPRTRAFFTHSGLLSTQEAIWYSVPMIGMPFIYDQHMVRHSTDTLIS